MPDKLPISMLPATIVTTAAMFRSRCGTPFASATFLPASQRTGWTNSRLFANSTCVTPSKTGVTDDRTTRLKSGFSPQILWRTPSAGPAHYFSRRVTMSRPDCSDGGPSATAIAAPDRAATTNP